MIQYDVMRAADVTDADLARWRAILDETPELDSPYFCPEFTQAVAAVRDDVYIGLIEEGGERVGYFPHQRRPFGFGIPVGGKLSDFHGVIVRRGVAWDAGDLIRRCGLVSWRFHHLPASQSPFRPYQAAAGESHFMDLQGGYDAYLDRLRQAGSSQPQKIAAKRKRMARDFNHVSFVPESQDPALLETLIAWKSSQYVASHLVDVFSFPWTIALLRRLLAVRTDRFAGVLSALYFDDRLAAVHMGMRSARVWHWWFPRHDDRFERYSPGCMLRLMAAEHAPALGVQRIDLGLGDASSYKVQLRSGGIPMVQGQVDLPSVAVQVSRWSETAERWIRHRNWSRWVRCPARWLKGMSRRGAFR
jgi:CelD/BcsL family acetyltransferase involved in cellulose biosynthesis